MQVGIFTFWTSSDNYGQTLQSFALQKYLNNQTDIKAEVIRYYSKRLPWFVRGKSLVKSVLLWFCPNIDEKKAAQIQSNKKRNFYCFKKRNICYSKQICYGKEQLGKFSSKYDVLIAGSDQVWSMLLDNPQNSVYFLDFGKKTQRRISYAASFGLVEYPQSLQNELRKQLSRFDAISVREDDGLSICHSCGMQAEVVLDPTFLLEKKVYASMTLPCHKKPYVFLYVLNINSKEDLYWNRFSDALKSKTILGTNASGYTSRQILLDGVEYENSTIEQWLSNIANAELVITTSFHGVVFSIIFQKNFIFIPLQGENSKSNNRVDSLLLKLGLEERRLTSENLIDELLNIPIDYHKVIPKLDELRKKSETFLKKQLFNI